MHPDLEVLTDLSDTDDDLADALSALEQARSAVEKAAATLEQAEAERDAVQAEFDQAKKAERDAHRRLEEYRSRLQRAEKALEMGVGDAAAAERQRVQCLEIIDGIETEMLEAMETEGAIQPRLDAAEQKVAGAKAALEQIRQEAPQRMKQAEELAAKLRQERDEHYEKLPAALQDRYDRIRVRKPPAVARIRRGACRKCGYTVAAQKLNDLQGGEIIQCRGCHRWLVPEDED